MGLASKQLIPYFILYKKTWYYNNTITKYQYPELYYDGKNFYFKLVNISEPKDFEAELEEFKNEILNLRVATNELKGS